VHKTDEPVFLIFDKTERLYANFGSELFATLLRLDELISGGVTCIFLASCCFEALFSGISGFREPIPVHFPSYSSEEMKKILLKLLSEDLAIKPGENAEAENKEKVLFRNYPFLGVNLVHQIVDTFYKTSSDVNQLFHLSKHLCSEYVRPLQNKEISNNQEEQIIKQLRVQFVPKLEKLVTSITFRDDSFVDFLDLANDVDTPPPTHNQGYRVVWKYVLIAAFIASHNNTQHDRQLFENDKPKSKKRRHNQPIIAKTEGIQLEKQFRPPRRFALSRLISLFNAIVNKDITQGDPEKVIFSTTGTQAMVLQQVKLLVELGMLETKQPISLDKATFVCEADYDYVQSIANSVDFKIHLYLQ